MKTNPQNSTTTLSTWDEVDQTLNEIAVRKTQVTEKQNKMDKEILDAQEKYQSSIDLLNADILGFETNIELFAASKKDEFDDSRSKKLDYGLVGFRKGNGKLATLKGFTWDACKNLVKASKKVASKFIQTKEDLNKNAIKAANLKPAQLAKFGMQITQADEFYYEVDLKSEK